MHLTLLNREGALAEWVRLCAVEAAPAPDSVAEVEGNGQVLCVANLGGSLHAMENLCPHRQGPLGQGWIEGQAVVCPWHAWAFDCSTGIAEEPEKAHVKVFPVQLQGDAFLVDLA